jgi:hypothetical protein
MAHPWEQQPKTNTILVVVVVVTPEQEDKVEADGMVERAM